MPEEIIFYLLLAVIALLLVLIIHSFARGRADKDLQRTKEEIFNHVSLEKRDLREEMDARLDRLRNSLIQVFEGGRESNSKAISGLNKDLNDGLHSFLRHVNEQLKSMQAGNEKKLEEMRHTVDEKLQKTLDTRLQQTSETISKHLESVNRGLGEMQAVAQSVSSLNRMLAGSKSRGILGEVQLGHIIEDMLTSQMYEREVAVKVGATTRVEYAVKLPGSHEGQHVFLPIDSKFPLDAYEALLAAYDAGEADGVETARKALLARVKSFARDIREKYVSPPETTGFAIMFLPTEGLYAEIARDAAFFEALRHDGIVIAGPTTFSAMLNSFLMGFNTLKLQRGAADIEKTLGAVKREFVKFDDTLQKAQQRITQAGTELENLRGTRTNAINRSLRDVQEYDGHDNLLGISDS
jgi:DNA recombination protein RmuC